MQEAGVERGLFQEILPRRVSHWGVCLLAVNGLIGTGIFFLPSSVAAKSGIWSPLLFLVAGLMLLPVVLVLGWLARGENPTGGVIVYVEKGLGPRVAEPMGWLQLTASLAGAAASFRMLMSLLTTKLALPEDAFSQVIIMSVLMSVFVGIQCIGIQRALSFLAGITFLKLIPLVALFIGATSFLLSGSDTPKAASLILTDPTLGDALFLAVFACLGFEAAVVPAGEAKNPKRDLATGMIGTYIAIVCLYALVQLICLIYSPNLSATKNPVIDTIAIFFGESVASVLAYGLIFSVLGYLMTTFLTAGRYPYVLAKLDRFPQILTSVHPRFGTPWISLIFFGVSTWVLTASNGFIALVKITTLAKLIMLSLAVISWLVMQRQNLGTISRLQIATASFALVSCGLLISCADLATVRFLLTLLPVFVAIPFGRRLWQRSALARSSPSR